MSVTVDQQPMAAEALGLRTVGQLLARLRQDGRLVVNLLVDGKAPDINALNEIRGTPLLARTIYIETEGVRETALDVLTVVRASLDAADDAKTQAVELLQQNQIEGAMLKLGECFSTWQTTQETVLKTSELLRIDADRLDVGGQSLPVFLDEFSGKLRQIKDALVNRDYVLLGDMLQYETSETTRRLHFVLDRLKDAAKAA